MATVELAKIFLVEDNKGDIRLVEEALKECKFANKLTVARDGEDALAMLKRQNQYTDFVLPDIIFLDLNLPKKDGREVLEEIKKDPILCKIPVIVLTSSKIEADVHHSYTNHANCYIVKPVDLQALVTIVNSIKNFWFSIVKLPSQE